MFIPLHVKSDYSLGFGTASVEELVERAAALGYRALALTDLENLYAQVRFHQRCREAGIRAITGVELRPGFDGRHNVGRRQGRVVLLAMDEGGYRSLCRIVSRRRSGSVQRPMEAPHRDPLPVAMRCSEGVIALSDDPAVVEELFYSGSYLPEQLGILLVRPDDRQRDRRRIEAAQRLGVRLVADLDCTLLRQGDHPLHVLQLAIRQGRPMRETAQGDEVEERERWLRSPAEAALLFADQPQAVQSAAEIAGLAAFDLAEVAATSPLSPIVGAGTAAEALQRICRGALEDLPVERSRRREYRARLEHELGVFERLGFSGFMAVVADILSHCRRLGIPAAVRGSAVSSLALHLLGGSPVDPLRHGLLFERFLHGGKSAWPDVDIDLPWHRRDEVIDWVYQRYGQDRVAMVAAHHTFRHRSALREGLKAWGASAAEIERMSALLPPEDLPADEVDFLDLGAPGPGEAAYDLAEGGGASPRMGEILPLINRLVGRPHHIAAHPGGMVIDRYPLEDLLPLERAPKGVIITQYDLVAVSRLGLAKIDLLGNRCLSELEEALAPATLSDVPRNDPATLALIDDADTVGCFQLESPAMRSLLKRLPIRSQSDITAALALIRPGAASGEVKSAFVRRARDEEEVHCPFRVMSDRLRETYGLFLYEEDVMILLARTGGMTLEEADELRRAIVKSGGDPATLAVLQAAFLEKACAGARSTREAQARRAWSTATRLAAYSFNKAHAASYALLAYYSAYAKVHRPLEFACALINHHQGLYPLRVEAAEFARMGIEVASPHVNRSHYHSYPEVKGKGTVRVGLDKVKGLSVRRAMALLEERGRRGPFESFRNLLERVPLALGEITALTLSGACDDLSPLSARNYPFAHEAALERLQQGGAPAELDRLRVALPDSGGEEEERLRLYQALVRVRNELTYLQMHLCAHPMALLREEASRYFCVTVEEARHAAAGTRVRLAVVVAAMRRVQTRQGAMQFLTVEDETGLMEGVLLPVVFQDLGDRIKTPGPFLVEGRIRRQQEAEHLEVAYITPFHRRPGPFGALNPL